MSMLTLNSLSPADQRKPKKRLGRGKGSGKGTYAGKGLKGQRARSGGKGGLKLRGLKATFKSVPKVKGFKSQQEKLLVMNVSALDKKYDANANIRLEGYKILGNGDISKALTVYATAFSKSAIEKIEQQGGKAIPCGKQS